MSYEQSQHLTVGILTTWKNSGQVFRSPAHGGWLWLVSLQSMLCQKCQKGQLREIKILILCRLKYSQKPHNVEALWQESKLNVCVESVNPSEPTAKAAMKKAWWGSYPQPRTQCKRDFKYALKSSKKKKRRRNRTCKLRMGHNILKRRALKMNHVALYIVSSKIIALRWPQLYFQSHILFSYKGPYSSHQEVASMSLPLMGICDSLVINRMWYKWCCVTSDAISEMWGSFGLADWITCVGILSCLPCKKFNCPGVVRHEEAQVSLCKVTTCRGPVAT